MNVNPNIGPLSGAPLAAQAKPAAPTGKSDTTQKTTDSVQLSPAGLNPADSPAPGQAIDNSETALETALNAAQQIKHDSPDALYDWSGMTPERLKDLLI